MGLVTFLCLVVASLAGGGGYFFVGRTGAGAWVAFTAGLFAGGVVWLVLTSQLL